MGLIELTPEFEMPDLSASRRGILDDPIQFAGQTVQGIGLGAAKVGYDTFSVGVGIGNKANQILGLPDDYRLDIGENFWNAAELLKADVENISPVSKGFTEFTAFAISTRAAINSLANTKRFGTMMRSSNAWTRYKANIAVGGLADIGATALHSDPSDASLFELVPEQHRGDFMNWFVDRENNSDSEAMFKRILEDLALGGIAETSLAALGGTWRALKASSHNIVDPNKPEDILDIADKVLGRGNGELRDEFVKKNTVVGAILGDDAPKGKRYVPVETKTLSEQVKAQGSIHQGAAIPQVAKKSDVPVELDADTIAVAAGVEKEIARVMDDFLTNPKATKQQRKMAKSYTSGKSTRPFTRLNVENSGAASIKGGLETNLMLNLKSKFKKREPRSRAQAAIDTLTHLNEGTLGLKLKKFVAEGAYDEEGVKRHLAMSAAMGYDVEEIIIASQMFRSTRAADLQKQAQALFEAKDQATHKMMKDFVRNWEAIDYHDAGIQSVVGSSARIMNYQQVNPSDIATSLDLDLSQARQKLVKGGTQAVEEESPLDYLSKLINEGDTKEMRKVFKKIAEAPSLTNKDLKKIVKGHDIMDYFEAFYLGSLLSGLRTTIGSVGIGGAAMTGWKTMVVPSVEGAINDLRRMLGGLDTGARSYDGLYNAASLWDTARKVVPNIVTRHKALSDILHVGFSEAREGADIALGVAKTDKLREAMETTAKYMRKNDKYNQATLMEIGETILAPVMGAQNMNTRFIATLDDLYKGTVNEAILKQEARRFWHSEGDSSIFGSADTLDTYLNKFERFQREYIKIKKTITKAPEQKKAVDTLFEGEDPKARIVVLESVHKAQRLGAEATMQQDASKTGMGEFLANMKRRSQVTPVSRMAYTTIFPFTKTPVNFVTEVIDHSPLAFTTVRFWDKLIKGTPEEQLETTARIVAGSSLMAGIFYGVGAGTISGSIAPEEREKMRALGVKEHSIFVDGVWYNYEKLGPLAALISSTADTTRLMAKDPDASILNLSGQVLSLAAENSHLATFSELMGIIEDPNKVSSGSKFLFDRATQSITPLYGAQSTLTDLMVNKKYRSKVDREVGGLAQELKASLARSLKNNAVFRVGSDMVGAGVYEQDIDVAGNDVRSYSDTMSGKFLHLIGVGNMDNSQEPYVLEGVALGAFPSNTNSNRMHGVQLTSNEFKESRKQMYHGVANAAQGLNLLVTSEAYKKSSDSVRKETYKRAMEVYKAYVNETTYAGSSRLQQEAYVKSLFDVHTKASGLKIDFDDEDYIKSVRMRREATNPDNKVTLQKFKEDYNIDLEKSYKTDFNEFEEIFESPEN